MPSARPAAPLVVHALWTRARTLALWVESPHRRPGAARPADLAALAARAPDARDLAGVLDSSSARALRLRLPCTPAGRPAASRGRPREDLHLAAVDVDVAEVRGARAVRLLAELRDPALDGLLSDGARWLAHVAAGARAAVDTASVVPDVVVRSGELHARWTVLPDRRLHRWRHALAEAAPPVLRAEDAPSPGHPLAAADVLDDVVALVVDVLVDERTRGARPGPWPQAPDLRRWLDGLRDGVPVRGVATPPSLVRRVRDWQRSGDGAGHDLVLRVVEPHPGSTEAERGDGERDGRTWRLQARLRPLDDPSLTLTLAQARAEAGAAGGSEEDPLLVLLTATARAGTAHPPLRRLLGATTDVASDEGVVLDVDALLDLVEVGGPALAAAGVALQLPRHWTRRAVSFSLSAAAPQPGAVTDPSLRRTDLVDFRWQAALGDADVTEEELRVLAAAKSPLVRFRGEWVHVDAEALARSAAFLRTRGTGRATLVDVLGGAAGVGATGKALPGPVTAVRADGVLGRLLGGEAEHRVEELPDPPGLHAQLRPYQRRGLSWLAAMARAGLGAVLADDMGLGKTLQLLALELHERATDRCDGTAPEHGPTLLVCPMSVVGNWQAEAARFAPGLRVHVHHGPTRPRGAGFATVAAAHDVVLTTYGLLVRDVDDLRAVAWRRVALDEAQHVKNTATRAARAVRAVPAEHRVALTGTPVENRLEDLRAVLDATNPGLLGSAAAFRDTYAVPVEKLRQEGPARRLAVVTRPFLLRRTKSDPAVAGDLPDKVEMVVRANLTPEQAALYQLVVDRLLERLQDAEGGDRRGLVLAALTRLKQVCNHPAHYLGDSSGVLHRGRHRSGKLQLLDDVVASALGESERVLCFTQFTEFGHLLTGHLAELTGSDVPFLHGGTTRRDRDALVASFSESDGPPVMVLSLRAGGTGLNLTAANHVVHVDRWWNPAVEDQATDRAHRIGQRRAVQVRKLVSAGTVEERVDATITRKREVAGLVVGAGESWITDLDDDALRELLVLGADAVGD